MMTFTSANCAQSNLVIIVRPLSSANCNNLLTIPFSTLPHPGTHCAAIPLPNHIMYLTIHRSSVIHVLFIYSQSSTHSRSLIVVQSILFKLNRCNGCLIITSDFCECICYNTHLCDCTMMTPTSAFLGATDLCLFFSP
jgi:hypothetical protein